MRLFNKLQAIAADPFRPLLGSRADDPELWDLRLRSARCPNCGGTELRDADFYPCGMDDEDVCAEGRQCANCEETHSRWRRDVPKTKPR